MCGHPGLPGGGELVSPPGPGLPGPRAVFSAGDVATFGCQASPQQTKHHAASAVIIVINQNYPPSRGWARACNDCNAGLITGLQWGLSERRIMTTRPRLFYELHHLSSISGTFFKCGWYYQSTGDMAAIHQSPVKRKSPIFHFLSPRPHNKEHSHCQYNFSAPAPLAPVRRAGRRAE